MSLEKYLQLEQHLLWDGKHTDTVNKRLVIPFLPSLYEEFFKQADLVIPHNKNAKPFIQLSHDAVLKYPHVEFNGTVCLQTELRSTISEEQFINQLIQSFCYNFLNKIRLGEIQQDFYDEPEHYWTIYVNRYKKHKQKRTICNGVTYKTIGFMTFPKALLLLDRRSPQILKYNSILLGNNKQQSIIAGRESNYRKKVIQNYKATQRNLDTLEIPLNQCYPPNKWPENIKDIRNVISIFADDELAIKYTQPYKLVILRAPNCNYGYFINKNRTLIPLECTKVDIEWVYGRYKNSNVIKNQSRKVVCFGIGALGSQVIPLLIKEGVGEIIIVDHDIFDAPNLSRHLLGMSSFNKYKASEIEDYVNHHLPTCKINAECITVEKWLQKADKLFNEVELFIDLTGSEEVRNIIEQARRKHHIPLITAWMEPFVTAAHVVYFPEHKYWKVNGVDLWEEIAAFRGWPDNYMESEPGCSSRFQSYSGIEAFKAVSITAEACINFLCNKDKSKLSQVEVTSLVRSNDFCNRQEYVAKERANWADAPVGVDGMIIKRFF